MALIVLAALFGLCAGGHLGYDYTPPERRFEPEYNNYQVARSALENTCRCPYSPEYVSAPSTVNIESQDNAGEEAVNFEYSLHPDGHAAGNGVYFKTSPGWPVPWHAGIYKKTEIPYMQICGGSLVTSNVIISAAHCFWGPLIKKLLPASHFAVALGKLLRSWAAAGDHKHQRRDIREIKVPPRFCGRATNFQDDLAVLILSAPVEFNNFVQPVLLSFDYEIEKTQLQAGNPGEVAGWGLTAEDGKPAEVLQLVTMPYVPVEQCIAEAPPDFIAFITSDKICAGHKNGTAACMGDSGGGLVFSSRDGHYLRGVVSTAPSDGHLCNIHTWATFTLISKHEWFIKDILEKAS